MSERGSSVEEPSLTIARLEARVAALEAALERRSRELRQMQRQLTELDLIALTDPAGSPFDPARWHETTELTSAEVEETLTALWRSLAPRPDGPVARGDEGA